MRKSVLLRRSIKERRTHWRTLWSFPKPLNPKARPHEAVPPLCECASRNRGLGDSRFWAGPSPALWPSSTWEPAVACGRRRSPSNFSESRSLITDNSGTGCVSRHRMNKCSATKYKKDKWVQWAAEQGPTSDCIHLFSAADMRIAAILASHFQSGTESTVYPRIETVYTSNLNP